MPCEINENTIPIESGVTYPGHWLGFGDIHTYSYTMIRNETITFSVDIFQSGTTPNATLKLYKVEGDEVIHLGTSYLRGPRNVITYDGIIGDYFFCLENVYESDYDLVVTWTDYNGIVFIDLNGSSGEYSDSTFHEPIKPPCTKSIGYKIVKGELPLHFTFESTGWVDGVAGEQDCESRPDETPSWNWKAVDTRNGSFYPEPKEYPITVRAYLIEYPFIGLNREFKICVHNNWDLDPADILNLSRTEYTVHEVEVPVPDQSELCPPCTETEEYTTEKVIRWSKYDITGFKEQLDKLMYGKQCDVRHKIEARHPLYTHVKDVPEEETLCPICPDTKIDK